MNKKLLFCGLIMATVCLSCTEKKSQTPYNDYIDSTSLSSEPIPQIVEDEGIDESISKRYYDYEIAEAKQREKYTNKLPKLTDVSSFGKKKAEVVWRAFVRDDDWLIREDGTVTVTLYEKGIKISRNGKSWFYGNIKYDGLSSIFHTTAIESVLHPGIWEPAYLELEIMASEPDLYFNFMYKGDCPDTHSISMHCYEQKKFKINSNNDMQLSVTEY